MEKASNKLVDLSVSFAVEILNLVKYLKSQHETIICNQIGRAGTSIGANIHEAQYTLWKILQNGSDFRIERKAVISKHGKGKAASRPFPHPDLQSPRHAP